MTPSSPTAAKGSRHKGLSFLGLIAFLGIFLYSQFNISQGLRTFIAPNQVRNATIRENPSQHIRYLADCDNATNEQEDGLIATVNLSTTSSFSMMVHALAQDQVVSKSILKKGCFDCHLWNRTLAALQDNENSFLLDIGSNIGLFGLSAAAMGRDVYAFEPVKKNWKRICQSLQMNPGFKDKMTLFKTALSMEGPQVISFRQRWTWNPAAINIIDRSTTDNNATSNDVVAPPQGREGVDYGWKITLDSLQHVLPLDRPVVIKIDVESHECQAFAGAMVYLGKVDIRHVIMETTPRSLRACVNRQGLFNLFTKQNNLVPIKWFNDGTSKELDPNNLTVDWLEGAMYNVEWRKAPNSVTS